MQNITVLITWKQWDQKKNYLQILQLNITLYRKHIDRILDALKVCWISTFLP